MVLCGLNAKHTISALWPLKVWKHLPLSVLHSLQVLSNEPVAILSLTKSKGFNDILVIIIPKLNENIRH
jgi:hypothetical protein